MFTRRLKDKDAAEPAFRFVTFSWALGVGLLGGIAGGALLGYATGGSPYLWALVGAFTTGTSIYVLARLITLRTAAAIRAAHNPSGSSTPRPLEYSYAASLAAHGRFKPALAEYQRACAEHPEDPIPYFRLAHLLRDEFRAYHDAIEWYRLALARARLAGGQEVAALHEIIEIYIHKLRTPRKAIPELKLLCERFPSTPAAKAAESELAEIQEMLVREQDGAESLEAQYFKKSDRTSATTMDENTVRETLQECGGNRAQAADRLGVSIDRLARKMRELGM